MSEHRASCPRGTTAQIPLICTSRIVAATRRYQRQNGGSGRYYLVAGFDSVAVFLTACAFRG